ncbi:hypothetical protein BOTBODRAFT_155504 [Botryobasidium botryosum FD-172 SS1]|uniref:Auxin efflux carrier n=1 Tax=Botryobasidium botryosum (strain FD-172 SS1) TaxID=930990 RepID=A0A067N012_BOTB1|nr:hypothetical protein BOTBODRAFT_155504 [Botryobasidium botryosum FD-172 SS1]
MPTMLSIGALIWVAIRPLLKMILSTSFGFILTRCDLFPVIAAKGAGQVLLNVTMPSLLFSKIVPAFTPQNVKALGPLLLVGILYQALGLAQAWIIRQFFWVPRRFHYGILAAGIWSNWGDVPLAVATSITSAAPFNGKQDSDLAVAYISVFILVFYVTLFPAGGHRLIAADFNGANISDDETERSAPRPFQILWARITGGTTNTTSVSSKPDSPLDDVEKGDMKSSSEQPLAWPAVDQIGVSPIDSLPESPATAKHVSFSPEGTPKMRTPTLPLPMTPVISIVSTTVMGSESDTRPSQSAATGPRFAGRIVDRTIRVLRSFMTPVTITICTSFVIALVKPLKDLFVPSIPSSSLIPLAPDGNPPLYFIYDTAQFLGNASIPLGLITLGSALAKMEIPRPLIKAPLGAILSLAACKMIILPVIGVCIVQGLTHPGGLIDPDDKVLRFVCIFFSCVPTATSQVFLTQVYSPDGDASTLSTFLIPQYALMAVSMTALICYTLNIL